MKAEPSASPRALGYRMPAEWERHEATWLAWPHNRSDWPGKFATIPWIFAEIVRWIARGERVEIFVQDAPSRIAARKVLDKAGVDLSQIRFHRRPTDRIWTRDSGPIFVRRNAESGAPLPLALNDFKFNAWAKYNDYANDDRLPAYVAKVLEVPAWQPRVGEPARRFVLEGGSIDVDGAGSLLTTEECLLSDVQARNPGVPRAEIERVLGEQLGLERVLWLGQGIAGDDTHGHVDDLARFVSPGRLVLAVEADPADANFEPSRDNLTRAAAFRGKNGAALEVIELPLPAPVHFARQRLPASYANFYICNAAVLVPVFNDPNDRLALQVLSDCFTDRPVVPIYCRDLGWGLGTLHCMTQQQPAV